MRQRLAGGDVTAEQDPFQRLAAADQAMQLLDPAGPGQCPDPHFRHADLGVIGHQPEIAGQRHLATAAQRKTVDRGYHRDRQGLDSIEHLGDPLQIPIAQRESAAADAGVLLHEIVQMRTGAKGSALPGDDQHARAAGDAGRQRLVQLIQQLEAQRVHLALTNHRHERDIGLRPGQRNGCSAAGSGVIGRGHWRYPSQVTGVIDRSASSALYCIGLRMVRPVDRPASTSRCASAAPCSG